MKCKYASSEERRKREKKERRRAEQNENETFVYPNFLRIDTAPCTEKGFTTTTRHASTTYDLKQPEKVKPADMQQIHKLRIRGIICHS